MNIFSQLALKLGRKYFLRKLLDNEFKYKMIEKINQNVDIPKLNETQERKLFSAVFDAIKAYLLTI